MPDFPTKKGLMLLRFGMKAALPPSVLTMGLLAAAAYYALLVWIAFVLVRAVLVWICS